jgi:ribonuclease HI
VDKRKSTQVDQLTRLTSPNEERIFPFLTPPWRRTATSFGDRLKITGAAGREKKEAAKAHKEKISAIAPFSNHLLVYTDGSMREIHRVRRVGAGVAIFRAEDEIFSSSIGLGSKAEVYDGELAGLYLGACKAIRIAEEDNDIDHLHFFADNTAAISTICDPKPRPGQLYAHQFHKKICDFLDVDDRRTVEIAWSPGHCDIDGNERADELAKQGVEKATEMGGTRSHALKKSKEKILKAWMKEWRAAPKTGRYATANRFPPSLKPTAHFTALDGKRELFGRVTQCRIGHCFTGEYYSKFVPSENIDCPCGEAVQTREHLLRECPLYEDQRPILEKVSRDVSLPEILGTQKGITALAKFLEKTGAFTKTGQQRQPRTLPSFDDEPDPPDDSGDDSDNDG